MSKSHSTAVFQELLDEVEVGNSKFIKPHIVKAILQWLARFADSIEEVVADLEGEDLDEDESQSGDTGEHKSEDSSDEQDFTDVDVDAMVEKAAQLSTGLQSALPRTSLASQVILEQEDKSVPLSLSALAALPPQQRTPLQARLLQEYHPLGIRSGVSLSSSQ